MQGSEAVGCENLDDLPYGSDEGLGQLLVGNGIVEGMAEDVEVCVYLTFSYLLCDAPSVSELQDIDCAISEVFRPVGYIPYEQDASGRY